MSLLWSEDFATGEDTIDEQHRKLFKFVNDLEVLVLEGTFCGPKVDRLVGFLSTYVQSHFTFEEVCMQQHKCPIGEKNKAAHKAFLEFYGKFLESHKASGGDLVELARLHKTVEEWLMSHICNIDTHLRACLKG